MANPKRSHRVAARSTRAWIGGRELPVVNLSIGGACVEVSAALAAEPFPLALHHPHLLEPAHVRADVVWVRGKGSDGKAGIRFLDLGVDERLLLRRCMLAEHGHAVWGFKAQRPIGYLVPTRAGEWGIYDTLVQRVADVRREEGRLLLAREGGAPAPTPSFVEAAARAFDLPRAPRIEPPITEDERPAPARLSGSAVLHAGRGVGYVARTGESWSFFDAGREPLGFMTVAPGGAWRVVMLGSNEDGSLDLRAASSYPEALAAAFSLASPPELRSMTFEPAALLEP
jgi:hypothetical protein